MTWQGIAALIIGAALAVAGALLDNQSIVGLGSTIVGGALGVSAPRPMALPVPVSPAAPAVPPGTNGR